MSLFTLPELEQAAALVHQHMLPTPQYSWPLLNERLGMELWVKHENHTPTGAFKVRGGVTLLDWLHREQPDCEGIITATRGNHGQSQARAATAFGMRARILVPHGNSPEKNLAMRAFGAELVEFGDDFDGAREEAGRQAEAQNLFMVPPFHRELVRGVSSYALELFRAAPPLDTVYVPIGCGSGICSVITVRDVLGLDTEVVGVVSTEAMAAKLSVEAGRPIQTDTARTFADGIAVRVTVPEALDIYSKGASRIVAVNDDEIAEAIRVYFSDTHNAAEGAGAAPLAALMQEQEAMRGKRAAVILCGGNLDSAMLQQVLAGETPRV